MTLLKKRMIGFISALFFIIGGFVATAQAAIATSDEVEAGSFLVLLQAEAKAADFSASQLLNEGISLEERQNLLKQKEQSFVKMDKKVRTALLATPSVEQVLPYPALNSYVIHVKDVAKAQEYLDTLAADQEGIYQVGRYLPAVPELDVSPSAILIRTDINPFGDGWWLGETPLKPITLAVLDDGVDITNPMLAHSGRKFYCQPSEDPHDPYLAVCAKNLASAHGTSMTGIYANRFADYPGITTLPGTFKERKAGPINNFLIAKAGVETAEGRLASAEGLAWILTQRQNPEIFPDVINYSQGNGMICPNDGSACDPLAYSTFATLIDTIIDEFGINFMKSAGNSNYDATKTTVTVPGDAYNLIAVGNLNPFDWDRCTVRGGDRDNFKIHLSSSVSPPYEQLENNEARRLLTVAAPGRSINTIGLNPKWCEARCGRDEECRAACSSIGVELPGFDPKEYGYWRKSTGTSPAAPMVGSVASLLRASGLFYPAAIKAVIVNSADSWTSNDAPNPPSPDGAPQNCTDPIAAEHEPTVGTHYDRTYGWGVLNASKAFHQRENVILDVIKAGGTKQYYGTLEDFEKATLVWQKHFAQPLTQLDLKLYYKNKGNWVLLAKDTTIPNNVKQVSNGTANSAPVDAEEFMLTVSAPRDQDFRTEIFALVTERSFD